MHLDGSGLEILGPDECRALLRKAEIGRIVFTHRALPAIQPVTFVLHGEHLVFRTARTSRLLTAATGTIVAFEADEIDAAARTGWSVVAVGPARRATEPAEIGELRALPLRSWAPGERDEFVVVRPRLVTGRRIRSETGTLAGTPLS
ncbi:pyridoxamine 5'-phosphate oxidase family protein [Actinomadura roseirufa]|uniref:pyridoxamine 5'-phosphate oxidase family protein n=1 Tax=Actinomadura roseirufa TaxID=2094049 RepID=UPI001041A91B|nr:pyridoxamine 5'-phosphate oxidase family protein [Actinomadura roseirufa]